MAGVIDDDDSRHRILPAYIDGRIDKLFANYMGAEVKEGQPLATFYSPVLLQAEREYGSLVKMKESSASPALRRSQEQLLAGAAQRLRQLGLTETQIQAIPGKGETDLHSTIVAPIGGTIVGKDVH